MPFPVAERVRYERLPLVSVTCQVSFPAILRIEAGDPVDFQERVRDQYPVYSVKRPGEPWPGLPGFPQVRVEQPGAGDRSCLFETFDKRMQLRLTKVLLALTVHGPDAWNEVRSRFLQPIDTLRQVYRADAFTHTCVRHRYIVRRSLLGLAQERWSALLAPWVIGPLGQTEIAGDLEQGACRYVFRLPNTQERLEANFGFAEEMPTREQALLLETHTFSNQRIGQGDVIRVLDGLCEQQRLFFRHALRERLHGAFRPSAVDVQVGGGG